MLGSDAVSLTSKVFSMSSAKVWLGSQGYLRNYRFSESIQASMGHWSMAFSRISLAIIFWNPQWRSQTLARSLSGKTSCICFWHDCSRLIHSLHCLELSTCWCNMFPDTMAVVPAGMTGVGNDYRDTTNGMTGEMRAHRASERMLPMYP